MQLTEEFLHYIWQFRLLTKRKLFCTSGEELVVINPGLLNTHAGPDFSTAELKIGSQRWVGNIEIHLKSSDWFLHGHEKDKSYDSVILHAVYENDRDTFRTDGTLIPVLLLRDLIPQAQFENYTFLLQHHKALPCATRIGETDQQVLTAMLNLTILERFESKYAELLLKMQQNRFHWNEAFYYLLIRAFGFKVNTVPFEILADALSGNMLSKHRNQPLQIAALLFGQAGFLEANFKDDYPLQLQTEFRFLRKKYQLRPADRSLWKFLRIHPQNFPFLRIAQLSALLDNREHLFAAMLDIDDHRQFLHFFTSVDVHPYWKNHSAFDKESTGLYSDMGKKSVESLIINLVCVLLYSYGKYTDQKKYLDRALYFLHKVPAEQNVIVRIFGRSGIKATNAHESQALLQLHKNYCTQKKCLHCLIGRAIICGSAAL